MHFRFVCLSCFRQNLSESSLVSDKIGSEVNPGYEYVVFRKLSRVRVVFFGVFYVSHLGVYVGYM